MIHIILGLWCCGGDTLLCHYYHTGRFLVVIRSLVAILQKLRFQTVFKVYVFLLEYY